MANRGIFINSDAWNFWEDNPELATLDRDGIVRVIERDIDFYTSGGGVAAIFYNLNFQRSFYPTKVGTPFWKDLSFAEDGSLLLRGRPLSSNWLEWYGSSGGDGGFAKMLRASKRVNDLVPDFIQIRRRFCRERGVEMWHSMRMDDVHHTYLGVEWLPQHCDLWLDRKDLIRAWYRHAWRGEWRDNALDYGKQEVFDYHVAMAREYVLDYESDGLELDWMRCCPVFAPGFDEANAPLLTRLMREVRAACEEASAKWRHPVRLAVRVPASVHEAYGMGMDIGAWSRERLFDILIPSCRDISTEQDYDLPVYRALCPGPFVIAPCIDYNVSSTLSGTHILGFDAEIDAGFASGWYHDGADTVYAYNHFQRHAAEDHPGFPHEFSFLGDSAKIASLPRRHVLTAHRPCGEGTRPVSPYPECVWKKCCNGGVKINCGQNVRGRGAKVIVGTSVPVDFDVLVNTVKCRCVSGGGCLPSRLPVAAKGEETFYKAYDIIDGVLHDGWNNIEFFNNGDNDVADSDFAWLEITLEQEHA